MAHLVGPRRPLRIRNELLTLFEESKNRAALKFGQAIRGGDVSGVKHFVDKKGAAEALKINFSFEIMVQRLFVYKSERCLPPAMERVTIQVVQQDQDTK